MLTPSLITSLQRTAGNAATTQLIIQRRLSVDDDTKAVLKTYQRKALDTPGKVVAKDYKQYKNARTSDKEVDLLGDMIAHLNLWFGGLEDAMKAANPEKQKKLHGRGVILGRLRERCIKEKGLAERAKNYLAKLGGTLGTAFAKLSHSSKAIRGYINTFGDDDAKIRQQVNSVFGEDVEKARRLQEQCDLSDAEVAAIKVYCSGDYQIINPALAKNDKWLKAGLKKVHNVDDQQTPSGAMKQHMDEAKNESQEHAGFISAALRKLPVVIDRLFRGEVWDKNDATTRYKPGAILPVDYFFSTTSDPEKAKEFAKPPASDPNKVGVVLHLDVKTARDVSGMSQVLAEKEHIVPPPSEFSISQLLSTEKDPKTGANYVHWEGQQTK